MISSGINTEENTFEILLDSKIKVSGTFKVIVVKSNSLCAVNFQVDCNKHEPPSKGALEKSINFINAQKEIGKRLSSLMLLKVSNTFPKYEEQDYDNKK